MFLLYWAFALLCWAYALWHGGQPARWAFALFVLAMTLTAVSTDLGAKQTLATTWNGLNLPLLLTDALYCIGLYVLALRSKRYWLIWSAGLQLLCVLSHFGPLLDPTTNPRLYRGLEAVWILPMMLTMVLGIAKDRQHARHSRLQEVAGATAAPPVLASRASTERSEKCKYEQG